MLCDFEIFILKSEKVWISWMQAIKKAAKAMNLKS